MKSLIIGITGSTGSGKSFISKQIAEKSNLDHVIFDQDNYFYDEKDQPLDANGEANFDTPNSLDLLKFKKDFLDLVSGKKVKQSRYNYNKPITDDNYYKIYEPKELIVVEGIFSLYFDEVFNACDITIFIDSKMSINIERRIKRDWDERGYDEADVRYKFSNHVIDSFEKYVLPIKNKTEFVLNNSENTDISKKIEPILDRLRSLKS